MPRTDCERTAWYDQTDRVCNGWVKEQQESASIPRDRAEVHKSYRPADSSIEVAVVHALSLPVRSNLKWGGSHVRDAAKKLGEVGYTAVEIVDSGKPVDAILTTAAKRKTDLIVTGAQGLGAVARFFLGSVSYQVAQHATCSVLIVR